MSVNEHSACAANDPSGWVCGRATHIRNELGSSSPILISTGGMGGDFSHDCTFLPAAISCPAIDIISVHRYASFPGNWDTSASSWLEQANGKLVLLEEWGIDTSTNDIGDAFKRDTADLNQAAMPNLYWQILPTKSEECEYDPKEDEGDKFGIWVDEGMGIGNAASGAVRAEAKQDWSAAFSRR